MPSSMTPMCTAASPVKPAAHAAAALLPNALAGVVLGPYMPCTTKLQLLATIQPDEHITTTIIRHM
jgi:hypothetical protein